LVAHQARILKVEPQHMAHLTDRILVMRGKKQKYGTQATWVNGKIVASPIEDEATVDERRKALGLEPMSSARARVPIGTDGHSGPPQLGKGKETKEDRGRLQ
jgi:hypothetical protein